MIRYQCDKCKKIIKKGKEIYWTYIFYDDNYGEDLHSNYDLCSKKCLKELKKELEK